MKPFLQFLLLLVALALALRFLAGCTERAPWQCDERGYVVVGSVPQDQQLAAIESNMRLTDLRTRVLDDGPAWLDREKVARADGCGH